jgi:hypothetical protein
MFLSNFDDNPCNNPVECVLFPSTFNTGAHSYKSPLVTGHKTKKIKIEAAYFLPVHPSRTIYQYMVIVADNVVNVVRQ